MAKLMGCHLHSRVVVVRIFRTAISSVLVILVYCFFQYGQRTDCVYSIRHADLTVVGLLYTAAMFDMIDITGKRSTQCTDHYTPLLAILKRSIVYRGRLRYINDGANAPWKK